MVRRFLLWMLRKVSAEHRAIYQHQKRTKAMREIIAKINLNRFADGGIADAMRHQQHGIMFGQINSHGDVIMPGAFNAPLRFQINLPTCASCKHYNEIYDDAGHCKLTDTLHNVNEPCGGFHLK